MKSGTWPLVIAVLAALLFEMSPAHAVWICHSPDGRSWQQDWPPCVKPADFDQQQPPKRPAAVPAKQAAEARRSSIEAPRDSSNQKLYDNAVAELEALFPELNPDLPIFNKEKSQQVVDNFKERVQRGLRTDLAIRIAVNDVMRREVVASTVQQPAVQQAPQMGLDWLAISDAGARGLMGGAALACVGLVWLFGIRLYRAVSGLVVGATRFGGGRLVAAAIVGGFIGSFFGLAGFGSAMSGMIPGAILAAVIVAKARK